MPEKVTIGPCDLYCGDCLEILPTLPKVDAIITDPPYSAKTHQGHNGGTGNAKRNNIHKGKVKDTFSRHDLDYSHLSELDVLNLANLYAARCDGWTVWMTDHTLAPVITRFLEVKSRYVFAPLPFYSPGSRVRLSGDGPSSWTDWIIVSRTAKQAKWGTLPGGYAIAAPPQSKGQMGGKPLLLMEHLVRDYSRRGDLVCDTHMGAGTTGMACVRHGRRFIGIEINKGRFDNACARIETTYRQRGIFDQGHAQSPEQITLEDVA